MPNPHGSFIWYELITPDADGAKAFYDAVVGWEVGPPSDDHMGYREIRSGNGHAGGMLPLTEEMASHGASPMWLGYIGVDDVDCALAAIEQGGGKVLMPAFDIPGIGRIAMVSDPQDAPFYVMKPIPPAGQEDASSDVFSPEKVGRCSWNELQTSNPDAARRFYGEQFGWESSDAMDMGEAGEYRFWDHHCTRLGAVFSAPDAGQPPHWRFYFRVPSIQQAKARVEHKGGRIWMGPHQVPNGEWIIIGTDPQGAEFALVGKQ
jgi:uncharacterized protein